MSDKDLPRCGSCRWFERQPMGLKQGFCFCFPPQVTMLMVSMGRPPVACTARPSILVADRCCRMHEPVPVEVPSGDGG